MFGFVHIQVVGLVVGLPDVGQSGGVLLQQAVDGVDPEPAAVVILLVVSTEGTRQFRIF